MSRISFTHLEGAYNKRIILCLVYLMCFKNRIQTVQYLSRLKKTLDRLNMHIVFALMMLVSNGRLIRKIKSTP